MGDFPTKFGHIKYSISVGRDILKPFQTWCILNTHSLTIIEFSQVSYTALTVYILIL